MRPRHFELCLEQKTWALNWALQQQVYNEPINIFAKEARLHSNDLRAPFSFAQCLSKGLVAAKGRATHQAQAPVRRARRKRFSGSEGDSVETALRRIEATPTRHVYEFIM